MGLQQSQQLQQLQQPQQPQLMSPRPPTSPMAGHGSHSNLTPPLTQRSLAAHNTAHPQHQAHQVPKLKFQSILQQPSPHRSSASTNLNLFPQAPANMRASILAAATTESTGGNNNMNLASSASLNGGGGSSGSMMSPVRPATTTEFMPPTSSMRNHGLGGGHGGSMSARVASSSAAAGPALHSASSSLVLPESRLSAGQEARFKAVVGSLKRRLDSEALGHRTARAALAAEVQARTQLQHLLWQCVETVRTQAAARRAAATSAADQQHPSPLAGVPSSVALSCAAPLDPRSVSYADLTESDRRAVVEWMLSQHQVMLLLFDKIFPADPAATIGQTYAPAQQAANAVPLHYDISQYISPMKTNQQQQQQPAGAQPNDDSRRPLQQRQEFKE